MITNKKEPHPICPFPTCTQPIADYRRGARFCSVHSSTKYQLVFREWEDGRRARQELDEFKQIAVAASSHMANPFFYIGNSELRPPYELIKQRSSSYIGSYSYVVETGKVLPTQIMLDNEPDLFIRFIELSDDEEAYLNFAKSYGLLDVRKLYTDSNLITNKGNEEPINLLIEFRRDLKNNFNISRKLIEGYDDKDTERNAKNRLYQWLTHVLRKTGVGIVQVSGESIPIYPVTLAGKLVLQLYQFTILGKLPKECELPGCSLLTTRPKYCSLEHKNLFNTWKRRKNIAFKNGKWGKLPPKKRGRKKGSGKNGKR